MLPQLPPPAGYPIEGDYIPRGRSLEHTHPSKYLVFTGCPIPTHMLHNFRAGVITQYQPIMNVVSNPNPQDQRTFDPIRSVRCVMQFNEITSRRSGYVVVDIPLPCPYLQITTEITTI